MFQVEIISRAASGINDFMFSSIPASNLDCNIPGCGKKNFNSVKTLLLHVRGRVNSPHKHMKKEDKEYYAGMIKAHLMLEVKHHDPRYLTR